MCYALRMRLDDLVVLPRPCKSGLGRIWVGLLVLLLACARATGAQTLEIHQIAVGNADSGLIIVRDATRVRNLFKLQIARQQLTTKQYSDLLGELLLIKFDDQSDHDLSTRLFKYHMARVMLMAQEQGELQHELDSAGFDPTAPNLNMLETTLSMLKTRSENATQFQAAADYDKAYQAVHGFDAAWMQIFADHDAEVNMTKLAVDKAATDTINYNLTQTVQYAVLIGIGRAGNAPYDAANKVYNYMRKYGVDHLNAFILSHYHNDHFGGFGAFVGLNPPPFIDAVYEPGYTYLQPALTIGRKRAPSDFVSLYVNWLTDALGCSKVDFKNCKKRKAVSPGTTITLSQGIRMTAVAANSFVYGETPSKPPSRIVNRKNPNANDFSLAWVLVYEKFRYFTGGDLSGVSAGGYNDIESAVAPILTDVPDMDHNAHVCAFKVSHHGSRYSSNEEFLETLKARVAVIPNGGKDVHGNPDQQVFHRLVQTDEPPLNLQRIYTLGMMKDDVIYKTRKVRKKYVNDTYTPWASIGRDLVQDGTVIVAGNVSIVIDDVNITGSKTVFLVNWDGQDNYNPDYAAFIRAAHAAGTEKHACPLHP